MPVSTALFDHAVLLEARVITLVRQAPELGREDLERAAESALAAAVAALANGDDLARLGLAIERLIDDLALGDVAQGVGLPAAAMASYTLQQAVTSGAGAGAAGDPVAVRGAIYELETMFPVPSTGRRPTVDDPKPDVPLAQLTSKVAAPVKRVDRAAGARAARIATLAGTLDAAALTRLTAARSRYAR